MGNKLKSYVELSNTLIYEVIRGFYITNGTCLAHSNYSDLYLGNISDSSRPKIKALASITDDQLKEITDEIVSVVSQNDILKKENIACIKDAVKTLKELNNTNLNKYLDKTVCYTRPSYEFWYNTTFLRENGYIKKLIDSAKILLEHNERKNENDQKSKNLVCEAIAYLFEHGKSIGKDFTVETAICEADNLAFEIEVEEKQSKGGWFSFSGEDMCENCKGWDGHSHRCDCGSRRVGWTQGYDHSFKNPEVYGEAN